MRAVEHRPVDAVAAEAFICNCTPKIVSGCAPSGGCSSSCMPSSGGCSGQSCGGYSSSGSTGGCGGGGGGGLLIGCHHSHHSSNCILPSLKDVHPPPPIQLPAGLAAQMDNNRNRQVVEALEVYRLKSAKQHATLATTVGGGCSPSYPSASSSPSVGTGCGSISISCGPGRG